MLPFGVKFTEEAYDPSVDLDARSTPRMQRRMRALREPGCGVIQKNFNFAFDTMEIGLRPFLSALAPLLWIPVAVHKSSNFFRLYCDTCLVGEKANSLAVVRTPVTAPHGPTCPEPVGRRLMMHRWDHLTFLHWACDPDAVQRVLPDGFTVETHGGDAWVALVPFRMEVTAPHSPRIPWLSYFPETNVRTYVTAPDGTTGVWFLSLDAARLPAVVGGRSAYRLPYYWSAMSVSHAGPVLTYRCRRRWPGPSGVRSEVAVKTGAVIHPTELTNFEHWLTARYRLYSAPRAGLRVALAEHLPWVLHRAEVLHLDDQLIVAAGLPPPEGDPIVHWSPGVDVRIGFPHPLIP